MTVYISGRVTGNKNYLRDFECAEKAVIAAGHVPVNPCKVSPYDEHKSWSDYMRDDLKALLGCDAIYMLKDWELSKGAMLEYIVARRLGMRIYYEE